MSTVTANELKWDAKLYDEKHDFVFKFGEDLVQLLDPKTGERILDLGCGTGYLSQLIADAGARVTGIDHSVDMIEKARAVYPGIDFRVASATDFHFADPFDAVFSNAVLHWVKDKQSAIDRVSENLKTGGRFVLEMGGKDNVKSIMDATKKMLSKYGYRQQSVDEVWYYPSLGEYAMLLENSGFRVQYATHYDRETELKDKARGIKDWLGMFGGSIFQGIPDTEKNGILEEIQELLRPTNFRNGSWWADYKRLRIVAVKQLAKTV
jgi:trans-aconitate methyltransferase